MYPWEGCDPEAVNRMLRGRDALRHRLLLFTGSPWPEPDRVLASWFTGAGELSQFLWRMEPARHDLPPLEIVRLKDRLQSVITRLDVTGPDEQLRAAYNDEASPFLGVCWWGRLEDLKSRPDPWPALLRGRFHADDDPRPLDNRRTRDFLEYIARHYCPVDTES